MLINANNEERVLIIDDEDVNFFALAELLKTKGYRSISANNALEANAVLKSNNNIKAIIMDIMMPGVDGIELTASIKADTKFQHIPIIVTSALTTKDYKEKAAAAGAEYYLTKPIDIDALIKILSTLNKKSTE